MEKRLRPKMRSACWPPRYNATAATGEDDRQPADFPRPWRRFDDDLHIASKLDQTVHQAALGNTAEPTAQQVGKLGLRHPQQLCGLSLGKTLAFDDLGNLAHELGLDQHLVGVSKSEVGVDVAGAHLNFHTLHFGIAHLASSFAICSATFNRSLINFMSRLGVVIPCLALF